MNPDTLKKAVELADGFGIAHHGAGDAIVYYSPAGQIEVVHDKFPKWFLDLVAAQLVRQVDALGGFDFETNSDGDAYVYPAMGPDTNITCHAGPDRTENTINAIVESKVLE